MPSHFDPAKKCRVGTMDEAQFEAECDQENLAYFRRLISTWTQTGGSLKWGAGGISLRGKIDDKDVAVCFVAPAYAGKKDRIELACATLAKQIGEKRSSQLKNDLREAAADRVAGTSMISIIQPGSLPQNAQKKLTKVFIDLLQ